MKEILTPGIAFAADIALKATFLFSITALAVAALRRCGAATRHFVGTAGLIGALALPLLTLALPRLEVPLLPPLVPEAGKETALSRPQAGPPSARRLREEIPAAASKIPESEAAWIPATMEETPPAPPARVPWIPLALAAWAAGTLLVSFRLAIGLHRVRGIRREASPLRDAEWIEEMEHLSRQLAVRRPVELFESRQVPVAITSGLLRPFLLLCRQARLWAAERRRVVLLHELAHVRRGDWIWLLLAETSLALYWWHPLAWVLTSQIRRDGEKACDDLVLAAGTKPSVYAGHLLGIFRSLSAAAHPVAPAVASARPSHFEGRLRAILDPASPRRELPPRRAVFSAVGLIVAAAGISAVSPWSPACSNAAILGPAEELAAPAARASTSPSVSATCPKKLPAAAKPVRALSAAATSCPSKSKAAPTSTATSASVSTLASPPPDGPEKAPDEQLPESGRTVPAILKTLDGVRDAAAGFVRASKQFKKTGQRGGSDWYSRAMDLHNEGRYDEAIAAFEKAIEAGYREDAASYNIACGYALKGDRDKAFEWLRRAMDAGFEVGSYLERDDDLDGLRRDPRWREFKKAAHAHPSERQEREAAAATARYERLASKTSGNGEALYQVGRELLNAGRYELSAKAFGDAAARGYRVGTSLYNEACALSRGGQTRAALDVLQKALDAGFDQPDIFDKDDDLDNVRDDPRFGQIVKEARELALPGYGTGWIMRSSERRAKWREAARRFEDYARAHPQKGRAWFNMGFASLAGDRPEAAVEAFGKALEANYRKPTTMYNLACSYARLDRRDQAFDWLFKALDAGFDAAGTLRGDEDLDNLRGDPRFRKALEIARARGRSTDD
ncbi:MAG TPA: M56 family metallopeptidase [Thermoanaerobaculia bacterium]|nr:M56 family metallopeptidase [Thermoanaerobaculia bacterium]